MSETFLKDGLTKYNKKSGFFLDLGNDFRNFHSTVVLFNALPKKSRLQLIKKLELIKFSHLTYQKLLKESSTMVIFINLCHTVLSGLRYSISIRRIMVQTHKTLV